MKPIQQRNKMNIRKFIIMTSITLFSSCTMLTYTFTETIDINTPDTTPRVLKPVFIIKNKDINESSGLTAGRKFRNILYTHNDSGDRARIFALIPQKSPKMDFKYREIPIVNSDNIDWEDICCDNHGNIIIADSGNNKNKRKNLALYVVPEPDLTKNQKAVAIKKIDFMYPEQAWWNKKKNFDCEAVFFAKGKLYLFTKHRSDKLTALYRFDSINENKKNPVKLITFFNSKERVTGADCSPDGKKLAVLTRSAVWLFIADTPEKFFKGKAYWLPVAAGQCEGICFYKNQIMISNEEGSIFSLTRKDLIELHR